MSKKHTEVILLRHPCILEEVLRKNPLPVANGFEFDEKAWDTVREKSAQLEVESIEQQAKAALERSTLDTSQMSKSVLFTTLEDLKGRLQEQTFDGSTLQIPVVTNPDMSKGTLGLGESKAESWDDIIQGYTSE